MDKNNAFDVSRTFRKINHTTSKANEGDIKPKKRANKQQAGQKEQKSVQKPVNHKEQPKSRAKESNHRFKVPGYSTVRMSRTLATMLKSIQKANGFKSRNALIVDMVRRLKPTYLDTTQKKAAYRIYNKMSLQDYELQKRMK